MVVLGTGRRRRTTAREGARTVAVVEEEAEAGGRFRRPLSTGVTTRAVPVAQRPCGCWREGVRYRLECHVGMNHGCRRTYLHVHRPRPHPLPLARGALPLLVLLQPPRRYLDAEGRELRRGPLRLLRLLLVGPPAG